MSESLTLELAPALHGEHQYVMQATAIACMEQLSEYGITPPHMAQGIANARWPGRYSFCSARFWPKNGSFGWMAAIDPHAGEALAPGRKKTRRS